MKTDIFHHVRKRRTSKISDEQQQQMQRGWFTSLTSAPGGAGQRWRWQLTLVLLFSIVLFAGSFSSAVHAQEGGHTSIAQAQKASSLLPEGFTESFAMTNGIRMHYVSGGKGQPLVLLHGFPETWYTWHKVLPDLAKHYRVIAPDMRGAGQTDAPSTGYDKATMARDIHGLVSQLGLGPINLVGHDVGLMVAYAYAALYPTNVKHLALLEAPIPDASIYTLPALTAKGPGVWWFGFFSTPQMPEKLIQGREAAFLTQFFQNSVPVQVQGSITQAEIALYAHYWQNPAHLHAYISYFSSFQTDAEQIKIYGKKKLRMPVLALGADHSLGAAVGTQVTSYATNVTGGVVTGSGHWIPEEQPQAFVDQLLAFLSKK
ncbi:dehalogenase [Ktedonobacter sp. SOSP1-52]|uniref:alpha/beta fold hydrolase n=1 Tax=Ktedonobacter sp. SOSP1-52 TaxID=2778366 RepID=UPI001916246F|nr:alpha/beta hydrolase [Ktedonobacter sp. SOSP1-52]GHO63202.1 dehalogenase [Ktedonobacter sp. SOSP1-52]